MRSVLISTPAFGGQVTVGFLESLLRTQREFAVNKWGEIHVSLLSNESLVQRGRNTLVARFMGNEAEYSHMVFIDADISWNPIDLYNMLQSLDAAPDRQIICGVYPKKKLCLERAHGVLQAIDNTPGLSASKVFDRVPDESSIVATETFSACLLDYVVNYIPHSDNRIELVDGHMIKVRHAGTGFMVMKRSLFTVMFDRFSYTKYDDNHGILNERENENLYALFDCDIVDRHYLSEDYLFCQRVLECGIPVLVDLRVRLSHTGTYDYRGNYGLVLSRSVVTEKKSNDNLKEIPDKYGI